MVTIAVGAFVLAFLQLTRLIAGKAFRTGLRPGERFPSNVQWVSQRFLKIRSNNNDDEPSKNSKISRVLAISLWTGTGV